MESKTASADPTFKLALSQLLTEIVLGPPDDLAYILNPGDPGLLRQLDSIDAKTALTRTMPGTTTIAAHAEHVCYGISLLNRWAAGEANPWADADWNASWQRGVVSEAEWRSLRDNLRREFAEWQKAVASRTAWDQLAALGAIASAAHTAYHLGAIRQILAAAGKNS